MNRFIQSLGLLSAVALLSASISSCGPSYEEPEGSHKGGFYAGERQVYFYLLSDLNIIPGYAYGSGSFTSYGQIIYSGELNADSTRVVVEVPLRLAGPTSSTPLQARVRIGTPIDYSDAPTGALRPAPAIEGTDFETLASSYPIPADSVRAVVRISFIRSSIAAAGENGKELILHLEATDDLKVRFTDANTYRIRVNDDLQEPIWWTYFYGPSGILGEFSKRKYQLLLAKFPATFWQGFNTQNNFYQVSYYTQIARAAIELRTEYPDLGFGANAEAFIP